MAIDHPSEESSLEPSLARNHPAECEAEELFRRVTTDDLTGLPNRALFFDRLRSTLAQSRRGALPVAVVVVGLDGLSPISDRHGPRAADEAIRTVARRLTADLRDSDTAARLKGDRFAIVLPSIDNRDSALAFGERISRQCTGPFRFEGRLLEIGVSVGVALHPHDGADPDALIEEADCQMQTARRAKATGNV